jgi:hypothetical protein
MASFWVRRRHLLCLLGVVLAWPGVARADRNDLNLLNLCPPSTTSVGGLPSGTCSWVQRNPTTGQTQVVLGNDVASQYRSLMSELGVVVAPRLMTPADTLGYAGFQFSAELGVTKINNNKQIAGRAYWDGVEGVNPGDPNAARPDPYLTTVGGFVRKGLWFPLPAFEFGVGAVSVLGSHMYAMQGYAKFALQEGFQDWVLPSFAVRGSASQLLGTSQVNLTVFGVDVLASKAFSIGGTARFEPFVGWNVLFIDARSGVIDATPTCDAYAERQAVASGPAPGGCVAADNGTWNDLGANFTFPSQDIITRYRWFFGAKLKLSVLFVTAEMDIVQQGTSHDTSEPGGATDESGTQETFSMAGGFDF